MTHSFTTTARICSEIQQRRIKGDQLVTSFSFPVEHGWGESRKTEWCKAQVWGNRGNAIVQHMKKGDPIFMVGTLNWNSWTTRDGEQRKDMQLDVRDWAFVPQPKVQEETPASAGSEFDYDQGQVTAFEGADDTPF